MKSVELSIEERHCILAFITIDSPSDFSVVVVRRAIWDALLGDQDWKTLRLRETVDKRGSETEVIELGDKLAAHLIDLCRAACEGDTMNGYQKITTIGVVRKLDTDGEVLGSL